MGKGENFTDPTMLLDLKTRALTQVAGSQGICCPRWSPDGRYVVAVSGTDNQKLMLLDLSRQSPQNLPNSGTAPVRITRKAKAEYAKLE